jgi:hypothetical protein
MSTARAFIYIGVVALFAFIAVGILAPNSYGNNPDSIVDESYFLTSSLSAIEKGTLPGWEFSRSGNYYGGVETYIDTVALVPALGAVFMHEHFSLTASKVWIAVHTGDLLHLLRLVSGVLALGALVFCFWYFRRRAIPQALAINLTLWLFLLLSNVMCIEFLHTAKVWTIYIIVLAVVSAFFFAQEYYLATLGVPFLRKETYTALLVWSGTVLFFQNYFGLISILLLALYALYLQHLEFADFWNYVKRHWYWIILFALTQISFMYRAAFMGTSGSILDLSARHGTQIDWLGRLYDPLVYAVTGQPLVLVYVGLLAVVAWLAWRNKAFFATSHRRRLTAVACAHPLIVYLIFHVLIGFSVMPRYGILLTMGCAFSIVLLAREFTPRFSTLALGASVLLFVVINVHAINLYWHPSSEVRLLDTLYAKYDAPSNVFIEDVSASRLTLPVNVASLALLDPKRAGFERFQFLLQHPELVQAFVPFKPLTVITYSAEEEASALAQFKGTGDAVWIIANDCANLCTAAELSAGTCWQINTTACGTSPQEVNGLPVFLSSSELGRSYTVRRVQ